MNKALLDTDMLSEIGKGKHAAVMANARTYRRAFGHYSFSAVTVLEIVRGYQKAQQLQRLNAFVASTASEEIIPLDTAAAELIRPKAQKGRHFWLTIACMPDRRHGCLAACWL